MRENTSDKEKEFVSEAFHFCHVRVKKLEQFMQSLNNIFVYLHLYPILGECTFLLYNEWYLWNALLYW